MFGQKQSKETIERVEKMIDLFEFMGLILFFVCVVWKFFELDERLNILEAKK